MQSRTAFGTYTGPSTGNIINGNRYFIRIRTDVSVSPSRDFTFVYDTDENLRNCCIGIRYYNKNEWNLDTPDFTAEPESDRTRTIHVCPQCCGMKFSTTAAVSQDWYVDPCGNFMEDADSCSQVLYEPDNDNIWSCAACGEEAVMLNVDANEYYRLPHENETVTTIVKFTDADVDGCGTNVETIAILKGTCITDEIKKNIDIAIEKCKCDLSWEWTTDDCLNAAVNYLKTLGFTVEFVNPAVEIIF